MFTVPPEILLPIHLLQTGECAEVADLSGEPTWVSRLAELGLRVGVRLQMLQQGSPCLVQLDGSRLSLRGDCVQILVRPVLT